MKNIINSFSILLSICLFTSLATANVPLSAKPIASDFLSDTIVRKTFFPVNYDSLKTVKLKEINKKTANIGLVHVDCKPNFTQFTNGDYEIQSNNGDVYSNARVYLITNVFEQEASDEINKVNNTDKEDIDNKSQPFYTEYLPYTKAGKDAIVFTGYNTSTDRAKMLLRFRVKRFIMTIETSGLSKEFVLPKFAELYEIAKVNMEKY